jgi:hypothetical protein
MMEKAKGHLISPWLIEAAFLHTPLLQRQSILRPPGKALINLY